MARKPGAEDLKRKQKRQKIILAVGGVLFVLVLAIQVPKLMSQLNRKAPATPTATDATATTPTGDVPLAVPSLDGAAGAVAAATPGGLHDEKSLQPVPAGGQLIAFSKFQSKDPFAQQISDKPVVATPSTVVTPGPKSPTLPTAPTVPVAPPPTPPTGPPAPTPTVPPTTALISVNGVQEIVSPGDDFPNANPIFHLKSLSLAGARISIVGGSFATGATSILLRKGKTLTLQNTADGTQYVIKLLAFNPAAGSAPAAGSDSGTTSTTPTVTTQAPTSTTSLPPPTPLAP
jgi:hypothetical protein